MGAVDLTNVTVQRSVRIRAFFSDIAVCGRLLSVTFRSCCCYYIGSLYSRCLHLVFIIDRLYVSYRFMKGIEQQFLFLQKTN